MNNCSDRFPNVFTIFPLFVERLQQIHCCLLPSNAHSAVGRLALPSSISLQNRRPPPARTKPYNAFISEDLRAEAASHDAPLVLHARHKERLEAAALISAAPRAPPHPRPALEREPRAPPVQARVPPPLVHRADRVRRAGVRVRAAHLFGFGGGVRGCSQGSGVVVWFGGAVGLGRRGRGGRRSGGFPRLAAPVGHWCSWLSCAVVGERQSQ